MSLKNYKLGGTLGSGMSGVTRKAYDKINKRDVAIKIINVENINADMLQEEIEALQNL